MPINSDGKDADYPRGYEGSVAADPSEYPEKIATRTWDDWELEQEERLKRGVGPTLFCWLKINDPREDGYETK